ncbi:MAG: PEP-CTERM sorting domain-containing protein [Phycisphaerae bacterium]|nr:PEP-CTERM sorting domain-containing protein [Phycisphaerae bacterium]
MKRWNLIQLGPLAVVAVLALGVATRGHAQTSAYELCIEQSPAQAGKLSPDSGTHRFSPDAVVVLSAEPQPGYQFAYWLGDVADPKSQRTTIQVSSSKMVVAVFQPVNRDHPEEVLMGTGGGGGGGMAPTRIDLSSPGWSIGGGGKVKSEVITIPVPVPEPATILLLGLGTLLLRRRPR